MSNSLTGPFRLFYARIDIDNKILYKILHVRYLSYILVTVEILEAYYIVILIYFLYHKISDKTY